VYSVGCYLLDDVPQVSPFPQLQHAILHGDSMKLGALFVSQERVRDPELVPFADSEIYLDDFVAERREVETRIVPLLPQVHAHLVVVVPHLPQVHAHLVVLVPLLPQVHAHLVVLFIAPHLASSTIHHIHLRDQGIPLAYSLYQAIILHRLEHALSAWRRFRSVDMKHEIDLLWMVSLNKHLTSKL